MNYLSYFGTKSLGEGESRKYFVILNDNAPEDLQKLVRDIHKHEFNDCLPNYWIYANIYQAFKELRHDELDNITIKVDCYSHELYSWLHEPYAADICDEAYLTFGSLFESLDKCIEKGQWSAKERIYRCVNDFIQDRKGDV